MVQKFQTSVNFGIRETATDRERCRSVPYIGPIGFDLDIRTRVLQADLTEVEARIGRVLLAEYPRFALLSANKLARAADASTASVSRFVTKLGYPDYAAFREQLSREI